MKKIQYIIGMVVAISFASCQKSDEPNLEVGGSAEVVFTSGIASRATGTAWDDGDKIGVFMYETDQTDLYSIDSENVLYTTSDAENGIFTSSDPLLYSESVNADFVAYHPYAVDYSNNVITLNTADQSSEDKVKVQDFMVASAQDCSQGNTPSLSFTRKMSKIVINVTRKDSKADAVLSDISLGSVIVDGTFTIINAAKYREFASVAVGTTSSDIPLFFNENSSVIEAIIIPQEDMLSTLNVTIDGIDFRATISGTFEENKQYSYDLTIGVDEVYFTTSSITDWTESIGGDLPTTQS